MECDGWIKKQEECFSSLPPYNVLLCGSHERDDVDLILWNHIRGAGNVQLCTPNTLWRAVEALATVDST